MLDRSPDLELSPAPMRIAVLSPLSWRTPPRHYGPWEQFASSLTEGLVRLGHEVTLFATADSVTAATLRSTTATGWSEDDRIDPKAAECVHIANVFERANDFDVIHNGFDFLPLTYSRLIDTPMVTTIHGFSSARILTVYERYNSNNAYVAISDSNRNERLQYTATIHHGIDLEDFRLGTEPGDDLLFFGRIHPDKGTASAIEVARRAGRRLVIAGIIQDEHYFAREVRPHLDADRVQYIGPVTSRDRSALLGRVHALLHLIDFDEPFGYSVIEAMACGTPVIATNRGSMPELIEHGTTGYLVESIDDALAAVDGAGGLDRSAIRKGAGERFGIDTMVDQYTAVYRAILDGR